MRRCSAFRPSSLVRYAGAFLFAAALAGCSLSYQLGGADETTGSVRPMRPGVVDPNPNDPYRVDTPGDSAPRAVAAKQAS